MGSVIRLFFIFVWTFSLMLIAPFFIPFTFNRQFPLYAARIIFAPGLMWLSGIKLSTIGKENVPLDRPVIFVANHASHLDIACLCGALPVNLHFIGKKELMFVPFVGWYMLVAGHIFIDRKSRQKAIASLKAAAQKIKQGKSVVMFPEGTRTLTGEVRAFKKGAFHLAIQAGVDIVPISIEGTFKVWPKNSNKITPNKVVIKIGKPIDTSKYNSKNINDLVKVARNKIVEMHAEA
jgi:1-acyl-sn-glycerol-3-phosphate acyltransferase